MTLTLIVLAYLVVGFLVALSLPPVTHGRFELADWIADVFVAFIWPFILVVRRIKL